MPAVAAPALLLPVVSAPSDPFTGSTKYAPPVTASHAVQVFDWHAMSAPEVQSVSTQQFPGTQTFAQHSPPGGDAQAVLLVLQDTWPESTWSSAWSVGLSSGTSETVSVGTS